MAITEYKRVLLKLSGESLCERGGGGIDGDAPRGAALELAAEPSAHARLAARRRFADLKPRAAARHHVLAPGAQEGAGGVELLDPAAVAASQQPGADPLPSLHSSRYAPEPRATLVTGVRALSHLALALLPPLAPLEP